MNNPPWSFYTTLQFTYDLDRAIKNFADKLGFLSAGGGDTPRIIFQDNGNVEVSGTIISPARIAITNGDPGDLISQRYASADRYGIGLDIHTGSARFDGLLAWNDASGRAQIVLSSYYSDLVIASSQINNFHGSTLTFVTTNPSNAGDYRKWVINQGNWGNRRHMLDFGYAANITNPHNAISSSATLMTLDGANMRVGIGSTDPAYKLDVSGAIRASTEIYVNSWFRNVGTGGLWNDTYSRGIRCADAEGNNYGNISTHGDGRGGWLGYGLGTRYCFMGKNTGEVGIHDNINSWCIYFDGSRNCTIYGASTLSSTLNVSGATTLSSTLNVSGITTLSSRLTVGGSITIQNNSNTYEAGCIYADANWGMLFRAAVTANIAHMRWDRFDGTTIMKIQNTGVLNFTGGGSGYAVENGNITRLGAVVIGNIGTNYGGGYQAGLLMECYDTTEISCHDSGHRVTSFIYYNGGNRLYLGRDIGWGSTPVEIPDRLTVSGGMSVSGNINMSGKLIMDSPIDTYWHLNWYYSASSPGAHLHNNTGTWPVSIWTSGAIVTTYRFGTLSDKRVKTNISPINNALSIIKKIEIVSFDYIDAINNKRDECGIIAQQLEEVFPNAVDKTTGIIPNIMKKVTSFYKNNNIITLYYTRNDTEENLLVGSRVKLILGVYGSTPENGLKKGGEYVVVVKNVESEYISVEWTHEFSLLELSIFIYGKEVDDLRNVDKEQLGILSLRGIQELCENNDRIEMRINQLEENNMILNTINKDQQVKLDKLQKDIDTLTYLVNQLINK